MLKNGTLNIAVPGVFANDTDADSDPLTAIKVTDPAHGTLTLNSNGSFSYTPTAGWSGADSFTYKANDGAADSNTVTVNITVNDTNQAPTDISLSNSSVAENQPANTLVGGLSSIDPDTGDAFTYTLVDGAGSTDNGSFNITDSSLRTSALFDFETRNSYSIRVRSTDQGGLYIEKALIITVSNVNEAPVITEGTSIAVTMSEDDAPTPFALTLHATDADTGDTLTWSVSTPATNGTATASGTGTSLVVGYAPNANYSGSDSFVVQVVDGHGGTASITVNVTIQAVNDAPVAVADSHSTAEDTALTVAVPGVLGNDTDADSNPLTAFKVSDPVRQRSLTGSLLAGGRGGGAITYDGGAAPANDANLVGSPTWPAGQNGQAVRMNGTTQYGTTPDEASLNIETQITLAAWVKPETFSSTPQYLIKKAIIGAVNGYELSLASTASTWPNKVFGRLNQVASGDTYRVNSTTSFPTDGSWMHVAMTYDGVTMRLYVNGVQEDSDAGPAAILTNTQPLVLGAQSDGDRKYQGTIDDARVYNRALRPPRSWRSPTGRPWLTPTVTPSWRTPPSALRRPGAGE